VPGRTLGVGFELASVPRWLMRYRQMGVPSKADLRKKIDELQQKLTRPVEGPDVTAGLIRSGKGDSGLSVGDEFHDGHDVLTSYGTLVIADSGRGKYLGPSAASEWLKDVRVLLRLRSSLRPSARGGGVGADLAAPRDQCVPYRRGIPVPSLGI
jgi:hypothetical protein